MADQKTLRWLVVCVLVSSSALNYLDRMVLSALAPTLRKEFGLSGEDLGYTFAVFSLAYGFSSPLVGYFIDRIGLRWGATAIVGLWSLIGICTGFVGTFTGLLVCRGFLGFAEAGGVPATGKAFALYLEPRERALGAALNQVGLTVGSMFAPVLAERMSALYGWGSAFVVSGLLGFVWIPFWLQISARVPPSVPSSVAPPVPLRGMLRDSRFLALILSNSLAMGVYSLWTQWTTHFLVTGYGLTQEEANLRYAWIPPIFATAGGLVGGGVAMRLIHGGAHVLRTRMRISLIAAIFAAATAVSPIAGSPALAVTAISLSLAATSCLSVNYYAVPLDLFGSRHAAFAVSALTGAFGLMQTILSPQIGLWSDKIGWAPVCAAVAIMPLLSVLILKPVLGRS